MDVKLLSQGRLTALAASAKSGTNTSDSNVQLKEVSNVPNDNKNSAVDEKTLEKMTDKLNKMLDGEDTHVEYEVHKWSTFAVIKIIDNKTDEVINEIPAKKLVDAMDRLFDLTGIVIDKKA